MGQFYDFRRYPHTAWQKSREARVKQAEKEEKEFNESWAKNPNIQAVRKFRQQQKLNDLAKFGLSPPDPMTDVSFSKNITDAEEEIAKKLGKGWNEVEDKSAN